ncbi:MAG: molecular chaperone DnaJ [Deltaproteobacteria bacterium]|nr:MAG: molecular chaperone DnaJ [Deltaproteobacteria bacterium]
MEYKTRQEPGGCGGCLLILMLLILITGGAGSLINFLGWLMFSGLTVFVLFSSFVWLMSLWLQKRVYTYESSQTESHNRFVYLLVQILIHISKIDGQVSKEEISTIQNFFQYNLGYNQTQMSWVKNLIKNAINSTQTLDTLLHEFKNGFAYEPRLILLELIFQLIHTKEPAAQNELAIAREIAAFLEITAYDLRTIEAKHNYRRQRQQGAARDEAARHYATLGLKPGASKDEIKRAYRKLSMQYHPDKVRHLGEEFRSIAEEKMKEINAAHDYLENL